MTHVYETNDCVGYVNLNEKKNTNNPEWGGGGGCGLLS